MQPGEAVEFATWRPVSGVIAAWAPIARLATVPPMGDWDERYTASADGLWSGRVNGTLAVELDGNVPGSALDVGCGEGADAIWLAGNGWEVTGLDVSQVALDRAAAGAREVGVNVVWICADLAGAPLAPGGYDLVSVQYPALKHSPGDKAVHVLLDAVAPGGRLLLVSHAPQNPEYARAHGFEVTDYVQPEDVRDRLDERWDIEVDETRPRADPVPDGSPFTHDAVLRARRRN
ncbi:MAG: Thioredoxin reductase [uncultured Solirubrobacteraceae bacterium]|uniref:Thioredoxin reductase n=1 Tax=uncultured Solirubrobacteraceae bacterium TaxID=1162706 RepID=A0A6J4SXY3_9ACTN|nr:MAG: Thioredoxin reductase [uncultured Solirubrobacteraceae bacterium]